MACSVIVLTLSLNMRAINDRGLYTGAASSAAAPSTLGSGAPSPTPNNNNNNNNAHRQ